MTRRPDPLPRINLTRFHGVLAPNSKYRAQVTPSKRGKRANHPITDEAECHTTMSWAQRLKQVFNIDIATCDHCRGKVKIIEFAVGTQLLQI